MLSYGTLYSRHFQLPANTPNFFLFFPPTVPPNTKIMTTTMTTTETERLKYELRTLESYLRNIVPSTPLPPDNLILLPNSLAIQSAIAGLESQLLKLERDEKLRRKFANNDSTTNENGGAGGNDDSMKKMKRQAEDEEDEDMDEEYVKLTTTTPLSAAAAAAAAVLAKDDDDDDTKMDDDWEDTDNRSKNIDDSFLMHEGSHTQKTNNSSQDEGDQVQYFRSLASVTIARIASSKIQVATPLGALGLALHVALLLKGGKGSGISSSFGVGESELRCTGVPSPDDYGRGCGGFAPPVRELPPGVIVPDFWEESAISKKTMTDNNPNRKDVAHNMIAFRYWRGGGGTGGGMIGRGAPTTVFLTLEQLPSTSPDGMNSVRVTFGPRQEVHTAGQQPPQSELTVELGMHVNLDGFRTAKKTSTTTTISPSLFYISLSELLSQFDVTFGGVLSPKETTIETKIQMLDIAQPVPPQQPAAQRANDIDGGEAVHPTTMPSDSPLLRIPHSTRRRGDFEGDLLPGGPLKPPFGMEDNSTTIPPGSQVGPDHPIFDRTFGDEAYYDYEDEYQYYGGGGGGGGGGRDGVGLPGLPSGMGMRPR